MTRVCTICSHPQRDEIDAALIQGEPHRSIASRYKTSNRAVGEHKANHLKPMLLEAWQAYKERQGVTMLDKLLKLERTAWELLHEARSAKKFYAAVGALRELARHLDFQARLEGKLIEAQTVNIFYNRDFIDLLGVMRDALEPFPDAREALLDAITEYRYKHDRESGFGVQPFTDVVEPWSEPGRLASEDVR